jgi:hypothetical protein
VIEESGGNIVLVNFNYRVGAYGFLASEKIRRDGVLNAGLLDQRKALEWVQRYISMVSCFQSDSEQKGVVTHILYTHKRDLHLAILFIFRDIRCRYSMEHSRGQEFGSQLPVKMADRPEDPDVFYHRCLTFNVHQLSFLLALLFVSLFLFFSLIRLLQPIDIAYLGHLMKSFSSEVTQTTLLFMEPRPVQDL